MKRREITLYLNPLNQWEVILDYFAITDKNPNLNSEYLFSVKDLKGCCQTDPSRAALPVGVQDE